MPAIEILDVMLAKTAHEDTRPRSAARGQQQVDVIGHEDVSVDMAGGLGSILAQQCQVDQVVSRIAKTGAAIIPSLDDMQRHGGQDQAWRT